MMGLLDYSSKSSNNGIWQIDVSDLHKKVGDVSNEARQAQVDKEKRFYKKNPQNTLDLTPTGRITPFGMPEYIDQHKVRHSESSGTSRIPFGLGVPLDISGQYVTYGKIWPDSKTGRIRYFNDDEALDLMIQNNFINPISKEKVPIFKTESQAIQWAEDRDLILNDPVNWGN